MEARHSLFLTIATVLLVVAVVLELGSGLLPQGPGAEVCKPAPDSSATCLAMKEAFDDNEARMVKAAAIADVDKPPGYGIRYLAMLDIILLATIGLIAAHIWLPPGLISRLQGLVMLLSGLVVAVWSFTSILFVLGLVSLMVGLLLAAPFGTAAYFAMYGFFDVGSARIVLSLVMLLKLGCCVCLMLAHPRYLAIKSLVLMAGCSLLTTFLVGWLHGLPGVPLVSITDGIAAIVVAIVGLIWAIYALFGGAWGVVKAIG